MKLADFNLKRVLKQELEINKEGWKRRLAIKAYRYKFYYFQIRKNRVMLFLSKIFSLFVSYIIRSNIPTERVVIDPGLRIPHAFDNVIITPFAKIGKNVTIYHDVTIGIIDGETYSFGDILIEDDVFIGAGAKIIGKCKIGKGTKIGANALVISEKIPPYSIVFAPKATIISKRDSENKK
ncbi:hypothetical protein [Panacibacter ginsenosidivorans]|nr:hypothetical protein [Panacibacter ginsenosidivorans]